MSLALAACVLAMEAGVVLASAPPKAAPPKNLRVGVLPVLSYARGPEDIYQERPGVRQLRDTAGLWQRRLQQAFDALDGVSVRSTPQVRSRILAVRGREALEVGRERYALGIERYRDLRVEQAVKHLGRAGELFQTAYVDAVEPREVADVAMYEGLAAIESEPGIRAHVAFRRMWSLDPARSFDRGYYPSTTEQALEAALEDLLSISDLNAHRWPAARLQALSSVAKVDLWITATLVGTVEAPLLHVRGYDARRKETTLNETLVMDASTTERLERVVSAWHACHVDLVPVPLVKPRRRPKWYVDVSYAHTLMLYHTNTRDLFHSPGVAISVTWEATDFLHGYGQLSYLASVPDPNRDLREPFVATRFATGVGLTGGTRRFRGFFRLGLEVAVSLTKIEMTQNVKCKHWGTSHELCTGSVFVDQPPGTWFGLVVGGGIRWAMVRSWYLVVGAEMASYFADAESELIDDLNFPLSMSLGLGTRF